MSLCVSLAFCEWVRWPEGLRHHLYDHFSSFNRYLCSLFLHFVKSIEIFFFLYFDLTSLISKNLLTPSNYFFQCHKFIDWGRLWTAESQQPSLLTCDNYPEGAYLRPYMVQLLMSAMYKYLNEEPSICDLLNTEVAHIQGTFCSPTARPVAFKLEMFGYLLFCSFCCLKLLC